MRFSQMKLMRILLIFIKRKIRVNISYLVQLYQQLHPVQGKELGQKSPSISRSKR